MKALVAIAIILAFTACAITKVETSKSLYEKARQSQEAGNDLEAIIYWKALLHQADQEIQKGHFPVTNHFLRASAYFEIGEWEKGFDDLKNLQPELLTKEEFWIYPLYAVMMGDYYSQNNMTSVADHFYQTVLKKSAFKSSSIYLLALERSVNNSIKAINFEAENMQDVEKFKLKEYESLAKEVQKYIEDSPFGSVPHFLLADLKLKLGRADESLEHYLASIEIGLPTRDLQKSAEFSIASLLSKHKISSRIRSVFLAKAAKWWGGQASDSVLRAGENSMAWIRNQDPTIPSSEDSPQQRIRYVAVDKGNKLTILIWEKIQ